MSNVLRMSDYRKPQSTPAERIISWAAEPDAAMYSVRPVSVEFPYVVCSLPAPDHPLTQFKRLYEIGALTQLAWMKFQYQYLQTLESNWRIYE